MARAVQLLTEAQNRSILLFLRNSERKTGLHFSWNCSRRTSCTELSATEPYVHRFGDRSAALKALGNVAPDNSAVVKSGVEV